MVKNVLNVKLFDLPVAVSEMRTRTVFNCMMSKCRQHVQNPTSSAATSVTTADLYFNSGQCALNKNAPEQLDHYPTQNATPRQ